MPAMWRLSTRPRCVSVSGATTAPGRDAIVRWVDAFNERDLEGMLARLHPKVRLHPLRLRGLDGSYRGNDGVQRWIARLTQLRHEHVIVLSDVHGSRDDNVLEVGSLRLVGNFEIAPFCALHRIAGGLIVAAHHYLSDSDMLEWLGLVP
jgi:SnoaL-like domain